MLPSVFVTWLLSGPLLLCVSALQIPQLHKKTTVIPAAPQTGNSQAQFMSSASGLDAPKVSPINATSFDWWYFDAVSLDNPNVSVVVTFFTSTDGGFAFLQPQPNVTSVHIWASFPNGSLFSEVVPATEAVIISDGQGSSGKFKGTGMSWQGESDLSRYVINVDSPTIGVKGSLVLNSIAPAHCTCGPAGKAGTNMEVFPHIGWANAVPDAVAIADFTFRDTKLKFIGAGYHDKNWGDQPFVLNVQSWYWGHARLGPYSIVWFDGIGPDGVERSSAYVARDGHVLTSKCQDGIKVRPTGANSTYPPHRSSGNPESFHIDLDLGKQGDLTIDVKNELVIVQAANLYTRWVGTVVGTLNGPGATTKSLKGVSLQEEFRLVP